MIGDKVAAKAATFFGFSLPCFFFELLNLGW
jgi:hypothetical protein